MHAQTFATGDQAEQDNVDDISGFDPRPALGFSSAMMSNAACRKIVPCVKAARWQAAFPRAAKRRGLAGHFVVGVNRNIVWSERWIVQTSIAISSSVLNLIAHVAGLEDQDS